MIIYKYIFLNHNLFIIMLLFFIVNSIEIGFGSKDISSISNAFSANLSHITLMGVNILAIICLSLISKIKFKIPSYIIYLLLLSSYSIFSIFWSPEVLKSAGLALLTLFNIFWGIIIGKNIRNFDKSLRFDFFIYFWIILVFLDFILSNLVSLGFASLDEYALIAFLLAFIMFKKNKLFTSLVLLFIGISGQSFSAILSFIVFIFILYFRKKLIYGFFAILLIGIIYVYIYDAISSGSISIYGKDMNMILTASGRFNAWQAVYDAIVSSNLYHFIFGHGYATDREVLLSHNFSWAIDVHNNILHIFYGLGLLGIVLFILVIYSSFKAKIDIKFHEFRLAIFFALMFFGFTSSYFFGRPSTSAIFWISFISAGLSDKFYLKERK